jgi:hypothetical protein
MQVSGCPGVSGVGGEEAEGRIHLAFGSSVLNQSTAIFIVCIPLWYVDRQHNNKYVGFT